MWKQSFVELYTKTFEEGQQLLMNEDIYLRNLDHNYYLTIDRAMTYAIQKYQHTLDNELGLF